MRRLALLLALAITLVVPAVALAHSELIRSLPADGSTTAATPPELRLDFSQPVVLHYVTVKIVASDGSVVASTSGAGKRLVATLDQATVHVVLPTLPHGAYKVVWRAVSADDLHTIGDQLEFGVGTDVVPARARVALVPPEPTPSYLEATVRAVQFAAIALLVGLLALALLSPASVAVRQRRTAVVALAAVGAGVGLLSIQLSEIGIGVDELRRVLLDTGSGQGLLLRTALVLAAVAAVRAQQVRAALAAAIGAAAAGAVGSHAAAIGAPSEVVLAVHLAAAAVWIGLVLAMVLLVVPALRRSSERDDAIATLRRAGWIAGPAAGVIAITGIVSAGIHVATVDALLTTVYGTAILVKGLLLVAAGALALVTNRALHAARGRPLVAARSIPLEALLLVAVLLPAGIAAAGAPARGVRFADPPPPPAATQIATLNADTMIVVFRAKPNRPGTNFVAVDVLETRHPAPGPITAVTLGVNSDGRRFTPYPATHGTGTEWDVNGLALRQPGAIRLSALIVRAGQADQSVTTPWIVGGAVRDLAPVTYSRAPITATSTPVAWTLGVGGLISYALLLWRRRRPT